MPRITLPIVLSLLVAATLVSCTAHIDEAMSLWEGRHFSHVLTTWGEPSAAYDDSAGGGILVYHTRSKYPPPNTEASDYGRSLTLHTDWHSYAGIRDQIDVEDYSPEAPSYRVFYVDADGLVYQVDWKGY